MAGPILANLGPSSQANPGQHRVLGALRTCVLGSYAGLDRPGQAPGGRISALVWGAAAGLRKVLFECGRPRQNGLGVEPVVGGV